MSETDCASMIVERMSYLPLEIVEIILCYADADTLMSASETCSTWKNLARESKRISQVWKSSCFSEIPDNYRKDIVSSLYPKYFMDEEVIDWALVFLSWKKWLNLESFDCYRLHFSDVEDHFSSVLVTGCWLLIIYPNRGRIVARNIDGGKEILLFNKITNICSVSLVCDVHPEYLVEGDGDEVLAGAAHDKAIVSLDMPADVIIDLRSGTKSYVSAMGTSKDLMYFENYRVQLTRSSNRVNIACTDLYKPEQVVKKRFDLGYISMHDIWDGKILFYVNDQWVVDTMKLEVLPSSDWTNESVYIDYPDKWFDKKHVFKYCRIIIGIQGGGLLITIMDESVGEREAFLPLFVCPVMSFRVKPTCALFHAGFLLVGTDQGCLYGYRVGEASELLGLELEKPCWTCCELPDYVQSLAVLETPSGPAVWASTASTVQRLTFSPKGTP